MGSIYGPSGPGGSPETLTLTCLPFSFTPLSGAVFHRLDRGHLLREVSRKPALGASLSRWPVAV